MGPPLLWVLMCFTPCVLSTIVNINWSKLDANSLTSVIHPGDIVNWVWNDELPHSIKSTDAKFTSSTIIQQQGYNYSVQFWRTGTFPYHCEVYATGMTGSVTVVPIAGAPTSSPTSFSTIAPDLSTAFAAPRLVASGRALPAEWTVRLEVRLANIVVNNGVSYTKRCFCYQNDCRAVGPTLQVKAGDVVTLIVENYLGKNANSSDPSRKQPNSTQFYMHGIHSDPVLLSFTRMLPGNGKNDEYKIVIPSDHSTGVHWYSSDTPGAAALHAMSALVGAIYVEPQRIDNVPFAIQNAVPYFMIVTELVVAQEVDSASGQVTQGCSLTSTCNASYQSPLCTGEETVSPYNPYRRYSIEELSAEAQSTSQVRVDFSGAGASRADMTLINGKLKPTVNMINKNPYIFKIINAGTGRPLHITLPTAPVSCTGAVIAIDGVYLQSRWQLTSIHISVGSRIDLEMFCDFLGTYTIYESGKVFMYVRISQSTSNRPPVKDSQLKEIRRPRYMDDFRQQNSTTIDRYFTLDMSLRQSDSCSYQIGYGKNCLNETVQFEEKSVFPEYDYDCTYDSWTGSRGTEPFDYLLSSRFVTFVDALNQWTIKGDGSALSTFSMKTNHFQIMALSSGRSENDWFKVGHYRDTIPLVEDFVVIRFMSADFTGEHTFQSDFVRLKEQGMKDSFLVVNYSTFQSLTQFPTQSPTDTPNDGIIQTLSFEMAVGFGILLLLGVVAAAIYLAFFTESRNTVFPDKVV